MSTTKQTLEVEVPEGWEVVKYASPKFREEFILPNDLTIYTATVNFQSLEARLIVRKKKHIRITFELFSEIKRPANENELYSSDKTGLGICLHDRAWCTNSYYYIWKEIEGEGDEMV